MSDVGVMGGDASILIAIGQRADGSTPIYGTPFYLTTPGGTYRMREGSHEETGEVSSTRGIAQGEELLRARFSSGTFQFDYVVTSPTGRLFQNAILCYAEVSFDVASAFNNPDVREGIIVNVVPRISDGETIEHVTIRWNADHA